MATRQQHQQRFERQQVLTSFEDLWQLVPHLDLDDADDVERPLPPPRPVEKVQREVTTVYRRGVHTLTETRTITVYRTVKP